MLLLRRAKYLLNGPAQLTVKTVATRVQGVFYNHATLAQVEDFQKDTVRNRVIDLGDVRLLSATYPISSLRSIKSLYNALTQWRLHTSTLGGEGFQQTMYVDRFASNSSWCLDPCWMTDLHEIGIDFSNYGSPNGPFFRTDVGVFAEDIGGLAADWFGRTVYEDQQQMRHNYRLLIPDRRATLAGFSLTDDGLIVKVKSNKRRKLFCGAAFRDRQNERKTHSVEIVNGKALIPLSQAGKRLSIWILGEDGQWLDKYEESEYSLMQKRSVLEPLPKEDPLFLELKTALDSGEGPNIEFKPWIPAGKREPKSKELLKTVIAFANSDGGQLYIGVNDDGDPVGITGELAKTYAKEYGSDTEKQKAAYVSELRKLFSEGIGPQVRPEFDWTTHAHLDILRVTMPTGRERPYSMTENGEIYRRVGATSRKMRHADVGVFFRRETPPVNGLRGPPGLGGLGR